MPAVVVIVQVYVRQLEVRSRRTRPQKGFRQQLLGLLKLLAVNPKIGKPQTALAHDVPQNSWQVAELDVSIGIGHAPPDKHECSVRYEVCRDEVGPWMSADVTLPYCINIPPWRTRSGFYFRTEGREEPQISVPRLLS